MTSLVQNRMIIVVALLLPTAASLWLRAGGLPTLQPSTIVVVGTLWLAATAVVTLNALKGSRAVAPGGPSIPGGAAARPPGGADLPADVLNVSRPTRPWRWKTVLVLPVELLALAWGVPVAILLVMVPVGVAISGLLWVGRLIVGRL